ncbi:MAG: hypothetical protein DRP24_06595 [Thermotoga sp.]|nr:MAG: hypothetical protein DRP24_06595 [Thermotoga sp.]
MKKYLSFGGGINSTALLLLLNSKDIEFETIFVDHGGDYPHTYYYVKYLQDQGFDITIIRPNVDGWCSSLPEYCFKYKIRPLRQYRWCTYKFKIMPIRSYVKKPCEMYIGISYDERHRVRDSGVKGVENKYPLVEEKITRGDCIRIIKEHDLEVPKRSGCWFCPFQGKKQIRQLYLEYPELYEKLKEMESWDGCKNWFNQPISKMAMEKVLSLSSFLEEEE